MFVVWILWVGALAQVPLLTTSYKLGDASTNRGPRDSVPYQGQNGSMPIYHGPMEPSHGMLKELFNLKSIDYLFPNAAARQGYNPRDMVAIDSFIYKRVKRPVATPSLETHQVFVTVWGGNSTPASLCTVTNQTGPGGNLLAPYPDWSWANNSDCDHLIVNVFRSAIDFCHDILIVPDSGTTRQGRTCPPKLLYFDLKTNKLVKIVKIPSDGTDVPSLLVNIVILECGRGPTDHYLALADVSGYRMLLYKNNKFKWISSPSFRNNPNAAVITSGGLNMTLQDGILGMSKGCDGKLYYRAFTSYDLCVTNIKALDRAFQTGLLKFKCYKNVFSSQVPTITISPEGALFSVLTNGSELACLDTRNIKGGQTILEQNSETLLFASSMRVVEPSDEGWLFVFTDNFVSYYDNQSDFTKINYRLQYAKTSELLNGTKCLSHGARRGKGGMGHQRKCNAVCQESTCRGGGHIRGRGHKGGEGGTDNSNADFSGSDSSYDDRTDDKNSAGSWHEGHGSHGGSNSNSNSNDGSDDGSDSNSNDGSDDGSNSNSNDGSDDGSNSSNNDGNWHENHGGSDGGNSKGHDGSWHENHGGHDGSNSNSNDGSDDGSNTSSNDGGWHENHGDGDGENNNNDGSWHENHVGDDGSNSNSNDRSDDGSNSNSNDRSDDGSNSNSNDGSDNGSNNNSNDGGWHENHGDGDGSNSNSNDANDDGNNSNSNDGGWHKNHGDGDGSNSNSNDGGWHENHGDGDGGDSNNNDGSWHESHGGDDGGNSKSDGGSWHEHHGGDDGRNDNNNDGSWHENHGGDDGRNDGSWHENHGGDDGTNDKGDDGSWHEHHGCHDGGNDNNNDGSWHENHGGDDGSNDKSNDGSSNESHDCSDDSNSKSSGSSSNESDGNKNSKPHGKHKHHHHHHGDHKNHEKGR